MEGPNLFNNQFTPPSEPLGVLETIMDGVGLRTPIPRAFAIGAITAGILHWRQPSLCFDGKGARPFGLPGDSRNATLFPWWGITAVVGIATFRFL